MPTKNETALQQIRDLYEAHTETGGYYSLLADLGEALNRVTGSDGEALHEHPLPGNVLQTVETFYTQYEEINGRDESRYFTDDLDEAGVVTSIVRVPDESFWPEQEKIGALARHRPVIDIDFPVKAIESSTPGHFHLYIDREMHWEHYLGILDAFVVAGVVEAGYVEAARRRGFTAVRLPWISKESTLRDDDDMPICFRCEKRASEFNTYMEQAIEEQTPVGQWVRENEGTYNPETNHFACDACYIAIGMPSSDFGWLAP